MTIDAGQDFLLLRPDYLLAPIFRAPLPYIVTGALLAVTCLLEWHTTQ